MNRLEKMLSKWNFKKIAVWYLDVYKRQILRLPQQKEG